MRRKKIKKTIKTPQNVMPASKHCDVQLQYYYKSINEVKTIKKREGRRSKYKLASFYKIFQILGCVWK